MMFEVKNTLSRFLKENIRELDMVILNRYFATEVREFNLCCPITADLVSEFRAALDIFGVLVVRGQEVSNENQLKFAMRLSGELHRNTGISAISTSRFGDEALTDISNVDGEGKILTGDDRRRQYGLSNRLWHTDASFQDPPGRYSMLSAKVIPESGGETEFANTRDAYYALSSELQERISGLSVHHSIAYSREILGFKFSDAESERLKGVMQPLIRVNSRTNLKSLYLAAHCASVNGMPIADGRLLIHDLIEHSTQRKFVYKHVWRPNDFVIWDNFSTMHRGLAFDDTNFPRELVRVTTLEERSDCRI